MRAIHAVDLFGMVVELIEDVRAVRGQENLAAIGRFALRQLPEDLNNITDKLRMDAVFRLLQGNHRRYSVQIKQSGNGKEPEHAVADLLAIEYDGPAITLV